MIDSSFWTLSAATISDFLVKQTQNFSSVWALSTVKVKFNSEINHQSRGCFEVLHLKTFLKQLLKKCLDNQEKQLIRYYPVIRLSIKLEIQIFLRGILNENKIILVGISIFAIVSIYLIPVWNFKLIDRQNQNICCIQSSTQGTGLMRNRPTHVANSSNLRSLIEMNFTIKKLKFVLSFGYKWLDYTAEALPFV